MISLGILLLAASGLAGVTHDSPATGPLLHALDGAIRAMPGGAWKHHDYRRGGNFFEAKWCRGTGAREDCQIAGSTEHDRDQHAVALYALHYDRDWPRVFGLGFTALRTPAGPGVGTSVWLSLEGQRIVGEGAGVQFSRYGDAKEPTFTFSLGTGQTWEIEESRVQPPSFGAPRALLARLLASPEALMSEGKAQLDAREASVLAALDAGGVTRCEYGPYQGGGIPPVCAPRPLTAEEQAAERTRAQTYFAEARRWLAADGPALYAALAATAPIQVLAKAP